MLLLPQLIQLLLNLGLFVVVLCDLLFQALHFLHLASDLAILCLLQLINRLHQVPLSHLAAFLRLLWDPALAGLFLFDVVPSFDIADLLLLSVHLLN